jgi:lysophospholipase L1-like esterase
MTSNREGRITRRRGMIAAQGAVLALVMAIGAAATALGQDAPVPAAGPASPPRELCAVPKGLLPSGASLRHTRSTWVKGEPLVIVAIGSGSTAGSGPGGEGVAYPHFLREALLAQFPGREVKIINQGHAGESAATMVARFPKEVLPLKPSLVIWQTGTVEAVRSLNVDNFAATLQLGIGALQAADADVILVNPQYAARIELLINYDPYLTAMDVAASQMDVTLFDRFHIMRHWVNKGTIDLSTGNRELRRRKAEEAQACIGMLLADIVARSIR